MIECASYIYLFRVVDDLGESLGVTFECGDDLLAARVEHDGRFVVAARDHVRRVVLLYVQCGDARHTRAMQTL